ncbi:MAG: hypothetical protein HY778_12140 [Betaproteobacteria bacterium]|nr:hypothetical protein [Betaproteobacteria bacterium]
MKRAILVAASLTLSIGSAFADQSTGCPTASLLMDADTPYSCFKTGRMMEGDIPQPRGAAGPVKTEETIYADCSTAWLLSSADDPVSCFKSGGKLQN